MTGFLITSCRELQYIEVFHPSETARKENIKELRKKGYTKPLDAEKMMTIPYSYYRSFRKQYKDYETEIVYEGTGKNKVPVAFNVWYSRHKLVVNVRGFLNLEETIIDKK